MLGLFMGPEKVFCAGLVTALTFILIYFWVLIVYYDGLDKTPENNVKLAKCIRYGLIGIVISVLCPIIIWCLGVLTLGSLILYGLYYGLWGYLKKMEKEKKKEDAKEIEKWAETLE